MGLDVAMAHMPVLGRACLVLNVYYWPDPRLVCDYHNSRGSDNRLLSLVLKQEAKRQIFSSVYFVAVTDHHQLQAVLDPPHPFWQMWKALVISDIC